MVTVDFNYVIHVSEMFGEEGHDSLKRSLIEGWFNRRMVMIVWRRS